MKRRQPPTRALPTRWLMTDERLGEGLWPALARLPRGGGVIFRHYATPAPARRALFDRVRIVARRRRLVLVLAGPPRQALAWGADGAHGRHPHRTPARLLRTAALHYARELAAAARAHLLFVSPVFATRSHPGAATLGRLGLARLARRATVPVVALGGMDEARWRRLGVHGWAAIDAWAAHGRSGARSQALVRAAIIDTPAGQPRAGEVRMPDDPVSRHWTASRLRLHYVDWGNEGAPLLLLIHGAEDHARSWDRVARALRRDWHVIAPDLRGHGDSDWSPDGAYSMAFFACDLAGMIAQAGHGKVTLVGHSLGGAIALRHAALFPEAVARVVAIEGLGASPAQAAEQAAKPAADRWRDWIDRRRVLAARPPRRFDTTEAAEARMRARFPHWPGSLIRHLTAHNLAAVEGGYRWKFDPLLRAPMPGEVAGADLHDFWRRVACPALLVYGAESWASNPAEDGRAAHFRDARTVLLPGAGHWVQHDRHDLFMAALRDFLGEGA